MMSKDKPFFKSVEIKIDFPKMEKDLLEKWEKEGIVSDYLKKNENSKKYYSFLDGPITANNPMGVHHAWGRTYKDLWQRYKNMRGYKQRFQNGFDAQGLWVEVEVEKELGFKSKKDIEKYGVKRFVDKCKSRVKKYADIQTDQSKRLGYFMDWDHSYFTLSDDNNYLIWHFLKVCNENDWLYKGNESVPWCPRCETAISQHEILTEDYKELTHKSIVLEFPIKGKKDEFLLVWTTTPWTIPANIAIAVEKSLNYSKVKGDDGKYYWLATDTIRRVFGKNMDPIETVLGSKLVGLKYAGPFDHLPEVERIAKENPETFHTVVATDERIMPVTTDEGTGLVHTAVSAGTEDHRLGKKLGLPMIPVIADNADYLKGLGFLSGKNAKDNPEIILDYLATEDKKDGVDWVFSIFNYKHRYPVCWRCKEELVWKVTDEWYIAMDKGNPTLRERMKTVTKSIEWIPSFGLKRELDWLDNMNDWLISKKNRYWGLALPIWECGQCGSYEVVGSKDELKEKAVKGWSELEGNSPHKPQIDEVKLKCSKCRRVISRIEPVGNPWLDAGIVAFSTISDDNKSANFENTTTSPLYLKDKKAWRKWYPADFITESFPGQFKNWFYSLIAMSTVLTDEKPFKTVFSYATLLAENGEPMHKSAGNMIEFNEGADKIGVDVMRWMYLKQDPNQNLLFGYNLGDKTRRGFHLTLWNIYNFFITYANLDDWKPDKNKKINIKSLSVLDRWILIRLAKTIGKVEESLDKYDARLASNEIDLFVRDLSLWYIRRSRDRLGPNTVNVKDKDNFYNTCYLVLVNLSTILAPFTPFVADVIYTSLTKERCVHLSDWPDLKKSHNLVLDENSDTLISQMEAVREAVEMGHAQRKDKNIPVRQPLSLIEVELKHPAPTDEILSLLKDELNVKEVKWSKKDKSSVTYDYKLTPELIEEGKARELIREIQKERKKIGLLLKQEAKVYSPWIPKNKKLTEKITKKTYSSELIKDKSFKIVAL